MIHGYVLAEGPTDVTLLKAVLPGQVIQNIEFVAGQGIYSSQSLASTILAVRKKPLALVLDTDTTDESAITEKHAFLRNLLYQSTDSITQFSIFLAVPEIETVFLKARPLIEQLAQQVFSDMEWELAEQEPRVFLTKVLGGHPTQTLLPSVTEADLALIQTHPLIAGLTAFLLSIHPEPANP